MSNGKPSNSPAYRPRDPFSASAPRSAERVPSSNATTPLPSKPKAIRVDPVQLPHVQEQKAMSPLSTLTVPEEIPVAVPSNAAPEPTIPTEDVFAPDQQPGRPVNAAPEPDLPAIQVLAPDKHWGRPTNAAPEPDLPAVSPPPPKAEGSATVAVNANSPSTVDDRHREHGPNLHEGAPPPAIPTKQEANKRRKSGRPRREKKPPEVTRTKSDVGAQKGYKTGGIPPGEAVAIQGNEQLRKCGWRECQKSFLIPNEKSPRRFCSNTCRGRASDDRTGKFPYSAGRPRKEKTDG